MSSARSASSPDALVVGGGIIGLSVAWRARARGLSVTVLERDRVGLATSWVAAGMLAPVAETEFGVAGRRLLDLGLRSAALWPGFAADLEQAAGAEVGLLATGTLMVARDADEAHELERQLAFRHSLGLRAERLLPGAARARESALAPAIRLALEAPDDHSVDPRLVLAALRAACESAGVSVREEAMVEDFDLVGPRARASAAVDEVESVGLRARANAPSEDVEGGGAPEGCRGHVAGERVVGVRLRGGERVPADRVVLAAGPWSGRIGGLPAHAQVPVRPVKGQILRMRDPAGPGLLTRVVRFQGGYLVPRADGRYVLGATVEEQGFEREPTAGGVYGLLRDATELVPGIDELRIEELSVGLRPGTPDNTPFIGSSPLPGLVLATGHYRNGILLAPLTAELVVAELAGSSPPVDADGDGLRAGEAGLRSGQAAGVAAGEAGSQAAQTGLKAVSA
jgi:glycine oxidase